jgi:hypothetical protein
MADCSAAGKKDKGMAPAICLCYVPWPRLKLRISHHQRAPRADNGTHMFVPPETSAGRWKLPDSNGEDCENVAANSFRLEQLGAGNQHRAKGMGTRLSRAFEDQGILQADVNQFRVAKDVSLRAID